jgi:hypothetical protein
MLLPQHSSLVLARGGVLTDQMVSFSTLLTFLDLACCRFLLPLRCPSLRGASAGVLLSERFHELLSDPPADLPSRLSDRGTPVPAIDSKSFRSFNQPLHNFSPILLEVFIDEGLSFIYYVCCISLYIPFERSELSTCSMDNGIVFHFFSSSRKFESISTLFARHSIRTLISDLIGCNGTSLRLIGQY